jgi:hypothetical protein
VETFFCSIRGRIPGRVAKPRSEDNTLADQKGHTHDCTAMDEKASVVMAGYGLWA